MHRFRSWTLDPPEWRTQRNRLLPAEGGDGSTLSLDFTTGVLDPRLTFTRGTNATFINSNGLVQWADSNIFYNSTWTDANNTPTAWSAGSGTASRSGETRTFTTSASQAFITQTRNTSSGIRYTVSVEVTAVTGTQRIDDVIVALGGSSYQYYFNGSTAAGTTTLTPGVVGVAFTAGAATTTVRIGSGVQGTTTTGAVTLRFPQFEPGSVASRIYRPNDSTTRSYEAPRFDYDPSTTPPQPRGLLIEGSASNLWTYSQDQSQWAVSNVTVNTGTQATAPDGTTSLFPVLTNTTSVVQYFVRQRSADSITATAGQVYTYSMFVKKGTHRYVQMFASATTIFTSAAQANFDLNDGTTGNVTNCTANAVPYGNGWWRLSITVTANASTTQSQPFLLYLVSSKTAARAENLSLSSQSIYVWGAQVELGSGASSYIPTGASTVNRSYDACYVPTTNFTTNSTNWSILAEWEDARIKDPTTFQKWVCSTSESSGVGTGLFYPDTGIYQLGGGVSNAGDAYSVTTVASSSINKAAFSFVRTPTAAFRMSFNGEDIVTGTQGQATIPDKLNIGARAYSSAGRFLGGYIRKIKYWPSLLSDNELKALSSINYLSPSFDVDFTGMSSLTDLTSRGFTFNRGTTATFINSQGLVEYASHNLATNTVFANTGGATPTSWTQPTATGTSSRNSTFIDGNEEWIQSGVSQRPYLQQQITIPLGLVHTCSVYVSSVTGSVEARNIIWPVISGGTAQYYQDNQTIEPTTHITPGRISVVFTMTAGSVVSFRIGLGCTANSTGTVIFNRPQLIAGNAISTLYAPSGSSPYHGPRFDYDPSSIGTPRGLLIEGSANNLCTYSGDMTQSGAGHWTQRVNLDTSAWTGFTAPDGTATAVKLIPNTTNGLHNIQNVGGSLTLVAYTASAFVKADGRTVVGLAIGGSQAWQNFVLTGNGSLGSASTSPAPTSTITPVGSTGWYRVTMTWTSTLSAVGVQLFVTLPQTSSTSPFSAYAGDGTQNGVQAWGYQLELGSGPSSLIPTGSSTGNRQADILEMTGASFSSIWPLNKRAFSLYCEASLPIVPPPVTTFVWLTRASGGSLHRLTVSTGNLVTYFPGGSIPQLTSAVTPTRDIVFKAATGSVQNDHGFGINNALTVSTDTNTLGTTSDSFYFNPNSNQFMHLRNLKLWLYRLPNQTLKTMTA